MAYMGVYNRVDEYIIANVNIKTIISSLFPDYTGDNVLCPFHRDRNPSLRIFPNGGFKCYGCGEFGKNIVETYAKIHELTTAQAEKALLAEFEPTIPEEKIEAFVKFFWNGHGGPARDYLMNTRKLKEEVIRKYKLGLDPNTNRITIPVYGASGHCVNIRYLAHKRVDTKFKCVNEKGHGNRLQIFPLSVLLQNKKVLLVEGEIDALTGITMGLPTITLTGGAGGWDKRLLPLFMNKNISMFYDNDAVGKEAGKDIAQQLKPVANDVHFLTVSTTLNKLKDINECWLKEPKTILSNLHKEFSRDIPDKQANKECPCCKGKGFITPEREEELSSEEINELYEM